MEHPKCRACGAPKDPKSKNDTCARCTDAIREASKMYAEAATGLFWQMVRLIRTETPMTDPDQIRASAVASQKMALAALAQGMPKAQADLIVAINKYFKEKGEEVALVSTTGQTLVTRKKEDTDTDTDTDNIDLQD